MPSFQRDPNIDVSEGKTIVLAGEEFLIPTLVLRQTIPIHAMIPKCIGIVNRRAQAFTAAAKKELDDVGLLQELVMTPDEVEAAVRVIAAGMRRAYPAVTEDAIYDMPIEMGELVAAMTTVIQQTHAVRTEAPKPGEGEATSLSIGDGSSQDSAST
jgi:hypothetical protein